MWENLKNSVSQVAMQVLGQRPRKRKDRHFCTKTKDSFLERGVFNRRNPNFDPHISEHSKLNKVVKKSS